MNKIYTLLITVFILNFTVSVSVFGADKVDNYGHRGCRGLMPENSMPSYKEAIKIGVDFVDMDVNMTKDGIVVVTHDAALNPNFTKDKNGKWISEKSKLYIKDMTLAEVQSYSIGEAKEGTKYAKIFNHQKKLSNIHIPTLKEVIEFVKNNTDGKIKYQIEIKSMPFGLGHYTKSRKLADAVYKIIKDENIIDKTEIQNFDWTALVYLNSKYSNVHTAYLLIPPLGVGENYKSIVFSEYSSYTGLDSNSLEELQKINLEAIGISKNDSELLTYSNGCTYDFYFNLAKAIKAMGGYCIEPMLCFTSEDFIKASHANNLKVISWDSESLSGKDFDEYSSRQAIKNNVDGIITDRPDLLKQLINSLNNYL